jgi:hypothetical protein
VGLVREAVHPFLGGENRTKRMLAKKIVKELEDDAANRSPFFVFCVSENEDDLSQWRAYGRRRRDSYRVRRAKTPA